MQSRQTAATVPHFGKLMFWVKLKALFWRQCRAGFLLSRIPFGRTLGQGIPSSLARRHRSGSSCGSTRRTPGSAKLQRQDSNTRTVDLPRPMQPDVYVFIRRRHVYVDMLVVSDRTDFRTLFVARTLPVLRCRRCTYLCSVPVTDPPTTKIASPAAVSCEMDPSGHSVSCGETL